jgi:hypothetical protein
MDISESQWPLLNGVHGMEKRIEVGLLMPPWKKVFVRPGRVLVKKPGFSLTVMNGADTSLQRGCSGPGFIMIGTFDLSGTMEGQRNADRQSGCPESLANRLARHSQGGGFSDSRLNPFLSGWLI